MKNYGPAPVLERCPICGVGLTSRYAIKAHAQVPCSPPKPPAAGAQFTRDG